MGLLPSTTICPSLSTTFTPLPPISLNNIHFFSPPPSLSHLISCLPLWYISTISEFIKIAIIAYTLDCSNIDVLFDDYLTVTHAFAKTHYNRSIKLFIGPKLRPVYSDHGYKNRIGISQRKTELYIYFISKLCSARNRAIK